jgi:integrase
MVRRHPTASTAGSPQLSAGKGRKQKRSVITLDEFTSAVYLPHIAMRKRSWRLDERILRQHISPVFGARKLAAIERQDVEDWLCRLTSGGLAPATCNRALSVFKTLCQEAALRGFLPAGQSPCAGVSPLKGCTLRERYLTEEEAQKLMRRLEQCGRPEASALRLLLLTGARKSEILRARWENVRTDLRLLIVPLSKSGRPRHIPLSAAAIAVLRALPRVPGSPWLFPGKAPGKPLSDLYSFWNSIRKELGLDGVRIHDLRHSYASFLVNSGHSLYEVQKLLGHSDPRTTMRYAHLGQAPLLAAAAPASGLRLRKNRTERETSRPDAPLRQLPGQIHSGRLPVSLIRCQNPARAGLSATEAQEGYHAAPKPRPRGAQSSPLRATVIH